METVNSHKLATLARSKPVVPSMLGMYEKCPLRYLLETERPPTPRLPIGPIGLRGTAVHYAIEKFSGKPVPPVHQLLQTIVEKIEQLVQEKSTSTLMKLAYKLHGMNGLLSRSQLIDVCRYANQVAVKHHPYYQTQSGGKKETYSEAHIKLGPERWFEDSTLDMAGKIDLVYRDISGSIHVEDFKTGNVTDDTGALKDEFLLQIAAYGVLVKRATQAESVILELSGPASSWSAQLDETLQSRVTALVKDIRDSLPKGTSMSVRMLASPGPHCGSCSYRPSCLVYLDALTDHSQEVDKSFLTPFDFVGLATSVEVNNGLASIRAVTSSGHTIYVSGVPWSAYPNLKAGARIFAFGLGILDVHGRSIRPANFFMFRIDEPRESAFEAMMYIDEHGS